MMRTKSLLQPSLLQIAAAHLLALRPRQWTKNLIVFAAPIFALQLDGITILNSSKAFLLFCAISSSFYLINDIIDVDSDRSHPVKCKRPIASGLVNIKTAKALALFLLFGGLSAAWLTDWGLGAAITCYGLLQVAYNLKLKRKVILDIIVIAIGFVLRAYGGAAASNILLSAWFLICTAMLALFLAIEKRKAELRMLEQRGSDHVRLVLYRYSLPMLSRMENTVTTGAVMSYAIWSSGPQVNGASTPWMLLSLPWVLYGIFRYQLLSDPQEIERRYANGHESGGRTERPEEILLTDRPILYTVIAWLTTVLIVLTLKHNHWIQ